MDVVDEIAGKVMQAAEIAAGRKVPRSVIAEAFYRGALAILVTEIGIEAAVATLRDSADRLADLDDPGICAPVVLPVIN